MKISLYKSVSYSVAFYPILYMMVSIVSDDLARLLAQLMLVLFGFAAILQINKKMLIKLLGIVFLCTCNLVLFGLHYVLHLDFYGFILLLLVFTIFSNNRYFDQLTSIFRKSKLVIIILVLYYIVLLVSVFFFEGLRIEQTWGISVPTLYGPFEFPHELGYQQIIMFCIASMLYRKTQKKSALLFMGVSCLCAIWTGVRSAALAMAIVVLIDYIHFDSFNVKLLITFFGIVLLGYLLLFTDMLIENPIVQKTAEAIKSGSITNGREDFNSYLINIYIEEMNFFEKIVGIGLVKLRYFMKLEYGVDIHAHNDFLNVLIGMGFVGFCFFVKSFFDFVKKAYKWFFPACILIIITLTNGLYMYIGSSPCIAIIVVYYNCIVLTSKRLRKGDLIDRRNGQHNNLYKSSEHFLQN